MSLEILIGLVMIWLTILSLGLGIIRSFRKWTIKWDQFDSRLTTLETKFANLLDSFEKYERRHNDNCPGRNGRIPGIFRRIEDHETRITRVESKGD